MYLHKLAWLAVENLVMRWLRTTFLVVTVAIGAGATMFLFSFHRGLGAAIEDNLLKGLPDKQLKVEPADVAESLIQGQMTNLLTLGSAEGGPEGISDEHIALFRTLHERGVTAAPVEVVPRPLLPFQVRWAVDTERMAGVMPMLMKLAPRQAQRGIGGVSMFFGVDLKKAVAELGRPVPLQEDEVPIFMSKKWLMGATDFTQVKEKGLNTREKQLARFANRLFFSEDAEGVPVLLRLYKGTTRKGVHARIVGFTDDAPFHGLSVPHEEIVKWHAWHNEGKTGDKLRPMVYNSVLIKTASTDDMLAAAEDASKIEGLRVSGRLVTARRLTNLRSILPPATLVIGVILFFLAAGGIVVGLSLSVVEQTRRIGILRAVGARQTDILFLFLCEALLVGVVGVGVGWLVHHYAVLAVDPIIKGTIPGVDGIDTLFDPSRTFNLIVGAVGVMVALLAGLLPAFTATLIRPSEVLKG